uniref:Uncharacterized protein n=1 Tax=Papilio xuthus TaxID=66420 RepID=I4DKL4_PAPXU|nr:unknown unsecreted protein [Papilio xuthus]
MSWWSAVRVNTEQSAVVQNCNDTDLSPLSQETGRSCVCIASCPRASTKLSDDAIKCYNKLTMRINYFV